jgi:hypothetical protein
MPAQTTWASEEPAVNHTASLEIDDATSVKDALDSKELCGSGLPSIIGNSAALRGVLAMVHFGCLITDAWFTSGRLAASARSERFQGA